MVRVCVDVVPPGAGGSAVDCVYIWNDQFFLSKFSLSLVIPRAGRIRGRWDILSVSVIMYIYMHGVIAEVHFVLSFAS